MSLSVIAVSGLGGHAFGSFKQSDQDDYMWLRDDLPTALCDPGTGTPIARIMVYGHDSPVTNSESFQDLGDISQAFLSSFVGLLGRGNIKPIIFIGHSLGGIIIKKASLYPGGSFYIQFAHKLIGHGVLV